MIAQLDKEQIRLRPSRAVARVISHILLQGRPLTTKGRWLNKFLLPQYTLVKKLPQLKPISKPIFILGTGRSGTTLLGKLLSLHPHICFLNEPKAIWHVIYPNEDIIGSYSKNHTASYRLDKADASRDVISAAHRLYAYALTITHSHRILDKYPEFIFRIPFIKTIFSDAKLLFLVRNGWDTSQSIQTWSTNNTTNSVNAELHDWWGVNQRKWKILLRDIVATNPNLLSHIDVIKKFDQQSDMGAVEWIVTMQEGLNHLANNPSDMLKIHYERLVDNPNDTLAKVLDFCELSHDQVLLNYAEQTVKPAPKKEPFSIHPIIKEQFELTMSQLGYGKG